VVPEPTRLLHPPAAEIPHVGVRELAQGGQSHSRLDGRGNLREVHIHIDAEHLGDRVVGNVLLLRVDGVLRAGREDLSQEALDLRGWCIVREIKKPLELELYGGVGAGLSGP
jgi:hypothetical protein